MLNDIRMAVLATNAVSSRDLFLTPVEATGTQYEHGCDYDIVLLRARDDGDSTPMSVFDQRDPATRMLHRAAAPPGSSCCVIHCRLAEDDTDEV